MVRGLWKLLIAVSVFAGSAHAELGWEDMATDGQMLAREGNSVVVATVVTTGNGTNGAPPSLELRIEETLSGATLKGVKRAAWSPGRCDCDGNTVKDPKSAIARWNASPLQGPPAGSRWIFIIRPAPADAAQLEVALRCRYPYSDEKKQWVARLIASQRKADREER